MGSSAWIAECGLVWYSGQMFAGTHLGQMGVTESDKRWIKIPGHRLGTVCSVGVAIGFLFMRRPEGKASRVASES